MCIQVSLSAAPLSSRESIWRRQTGTPVQRCLHHLQCDHCLVCLLGSYEDVPPSWNQLLKLAHLKMFPVWVRPHLWTFGPLDTHDSRFMSWALLQLSAQAWIAPNGSHVRSETYEPSSCQSVSAESVHWAETGQQPSWGEWRVQWLRLEK